MTWLIIYLLFLHWLGDFLFQTKYIADNKAKSLDILILHVFLYGVVLFIGLSPCYTLISVCRFVVINWVAHLCTDVLTVQAAAHARKTKGIHHYFAVIGFDQFIHTSTLIATMVLLK